MDRTTLPACLPAATFVSSYDSSVWLEFDLAGKSYQLFDNWNFGSEIPEDSPERFVLGEYLVPREQAEEEEHFRNLGSFPTAAAALATLAAP